MSTLVSIGDNSTAHNFSYVELVMCPAMDFDPRSGSGSGAYMRTGKSREPSSCSLLKKNNRGQASNIFKQEEVVGFVSMICPDLASFEPPSPFRRGVLTTFLSKPVMVLVGFPKNAMFFGFCLYFIIRRSLKIFKLLRC